MPESKALLIKRFGRSAQAAPFGFISQQLLCEFHHTGQVAGRSESNGITFGPQSLGEIPDRSDDGKAESEPSHYGRAPAAHTIRIRLDQDITSAQVTRKVRRFERTGGVNPRG